MRISVVIATFNRAVLLDTTLQALKTQDYGSDDEVIVVDNGSGDGTQEVLARASIGFPVPLRRLIEPSPGKTAAMIAGLSAATGEVIALTDDDVRVSGNWIATLRRIFDDPSVDLVGGRVDPLWQRPAPWWLRVERSDGRYDPLCGPLALLHYGEAQPLGSRTAVGANMAIRRGVLDALSGLKRDLGRHRGTLLCGEDHDLCQRAVAAGFRCEYRPELRARHWVPAERARVRYFLRWFFWSGVTHALLEAHALAGDGRGRPAHRYFLRRLLVSPLTIAARLLTGRPRHAIEAAMDAAFAAGYLIRRFDRLKPGRRSERPEADAGAAHQRAGVHG